MEATESLWQHCVSMVQTLRIAMRDNKSFYDPAVRSVRLQLRVAYEAFLLQDYNGAQVVPYPGVEVQNLKVCADVGY